MRTRTHGSSALKEQREPIKRFEVRDVEHLIEVLKRLNLSKEMAVFNIKRYCYEAEMEYILNALGFEYKANRKIKVSKTVQKQAELFAFIFDNNRDGFVRFRNKSTGEYRAYPAESIKDAYKLNAILKSKYFSNMNDMMYSLNVYNNMYRAEGKHLLSIHLLAVDLDYDKVPELAHMRPESVIKRLEKEFELTIPTPSFIEWGHRIRLLYKIKCVGANKKSIKVARLVTKAIADRLKAYGATAQALTTYARLLGSVNSKNNSTIKVKLLRAEPYRLRDFQETLLDKPDWLSRWKEKVKKLNKNAKKVVQIQNPYTLNLARLRDLEKIQAYMNATDRFIGYREALCYLYRNYCLLAGMSREEAKRATLEFNHKFKVPERDKVIEQDTRHLERKQYLHKNETILEFLDISHDEEVKLNLETIISETEKKRRNNEYNKAKYHANKETLLAKAKEKYRDKVGASKQEKIEVEKQKIKSLLAEGFKRKEICSQLGINPRTFDRRKAELIKEGLLQ